MEAQIFDIEGPLLLKSKCFRDERGYFTESFNQAGFEKLVGKSIQFVQDNYSRSLGRVIRGLHYQLPPAAQGKLVRCVRGAIFDVAVDIRKTSLTFGRWIGVELSEDNLDMLWIPPGFAHGFCTLSEVTDVFYKVTDYFDKTSDRSLHWKDEQIDIRWPISRAPIISAKDSTAPVLFAAEVF